MIADSLPSARSVAAVLNITDLVAGDDPADDRSLPVIIRGNQSSRAVMQLQGRISQCIGNAILGKLRANGANNYPFGSVPCTMNPPIITLSPVCTKARVLMLPRIVATPPNSNAPTSGTPIRPYPRWSWGGAAGSPWSIAGLPDCRA